jgi:tRNA G46 methylase TrmB
MTNMNDMYVDGEYLKHNPTRDVEDSAWKAYLIYRMIQKHKLNPLSICEVGCGCGEILKQLQQRMPPECLFTGYEISPQAIELCGQRANERLYLILKNMSEDLIEHLEDYFLFLRRIKEKNRHNILHIPLEMFIFCVSSTIPSGTTKKSWSSSFLLQGRSTADTLESGM